MSAPEGWIWWIIGLAALCLAALGLMVAAAGLIRRNRRVRQQTVAIQPGEADVLREALEVHRAECAAQLAMLSKNLEALEASMAAPPTDVLRDSRLNVSARAQALQLLRAGMEPDTAAVTLAVASRDIRLLAKVSRLLAVR